MHSQFPQLREQQALRLEQEARQQVMGVEFRARAILEEQRCANCRSGEFRAQHARGDGGEYRAQFVNKMRSCTAKVNTAKTRDMSSSNLLRSCPGEKELIEKLSLKWIRKWTSCERFVSELREEAYQDATSQDGEVWRLNCGGAGPLRTSSRIK